MDKPNLIHNIPPSLDNLFQMIWNNQYLEIDQRKGAELKIMIRKIVDQLHFLFGKEAEVIIERLFYFFIKRAKMWLEVEGVKDENIELLVQQINNSIKTGNRLTLEENTIKSILSKVENNDYQLNEALYLIKLFASLIYGKFGSKLLIEEIFLFSLTTYSVVLAEKQRRILLKWILEEGLPSICLGKQTIPIEDFLYTI